VAPDGGIRADLHDALALAVPARHGHLSPLGWEHVNLTGDYVWATAGEVPETRDGFRPLRAVPDAARLAA
jgi:hypothetical protein